MWAEAMDFHRSDWITHTCVHQDWLGSTLNEECKDRHRYSTRLPCEAPKDIKSAADFRPPEQERVYSILGGRHCCSPAAAEFEAGVAAFYTPKALFRPIHSKELGQIPGA